MLYTLYTVNLPDTKNVIKATLTDNTTVLGVSNNNKYASSVLQKRT